MLTHAHYESFTSLLREELIPAMGCTEPIAIALAAAIAQKVLGEPFTKLRVGCSSSIIKNAKSAIIPVTDGLAGIDAAALAGAIGGAPEKGMEVLAFITDAQRQKIAEACRKNLCESYHLNSEHVLHIIIEIEGAQHRAKIEVQDAHDNITFLSRDGEVLLSKSAESANDKAGGVDRSILTLESIWEYANTVDLEAIRPILAPQIEYNLAIAQEGLSGSYGLHYGAMLLRASKTVYEKMEAYAAAASEARMSGCSMPVVINSGSGNQGITSSVPCIVYCREMGYSEERMLRMLAFANLTTIYQKRFIGKLSAFCGAISAACASGAALTYVEGGTLEQIGNTISNTMAVTMGVICDGAKVSCGAKIATGLHVAIIAHKLALENRAYRPGDGIVCEDADSTIRGVGRIAKNGMAATDNEIIAVMLDN